MVASFNLMLRGYSVWNLAQFSINVLSPLENKSSNKMLKGSLSNYNLNKSYRLYSAYSLCSSD